MDPGTVPSLPLTPRNQAPEALLSESDWVRRLARRLVKDVAEAEDLAQEALSRGLEQGPEAVSLRAWLGGVVRNLARQGHRSSARRKAREASVARDERLPSAAEALERLQLQQGVVRAVLALEEPYRSTVVLRFYDDLAPRAIAKREGVPVATVKTRLARGLAQLRARLDHEHGGDGRSWALVLLPLATGGRGLVPLATGVLAVNTLVKLGLSAAALAAIVFLVARREAKAPPLVAEAASGAPIAELAPAPAVEVDARAPAVREEISAAPEVAPEVAASAPAPAATISGRVIDLTGAPVAGVALGLRRANGSRIDDAGFDSTLWEQDLADVHPAARSAPDGGFSFSRDGEVWGRIVSVDEDWETALAPYVIRGGDERNSVVVSPRIRLTGIVQDDGGAPLADVELRFGLPEGSLLAAGEDLAETMSIGWEARTDAEGRFVLDRLPSIPRARLRVRLAPYETQVLVRDSWVDEELVVVLREPEGEWLAGRVDAGGQPVASAWVFLGGASTRSDERGEFRLHLGGLEKEEELVAAAPRHTPGRLVGDVNEDGTVRWPAFARLELGGAPLALAGTVVDADGNARAGQEIWLTEGRVIYSDGFPSVLETIVAGEREIRHGTKTDESGRFRLEGLEPRDYGLCVVDPETTLVVNLGPFRAGTTDLRLRQPTDELLPLVRGRVVSRSGAAVEGATVRVSRSLEPVGLPGHNYFGFEASGASTTTGSDGSFELHDVPRSGSQLSVYGSDLVDPEFALELDADPLALVVTVDRWTSLEVRVGDEFRGASSFAALDAAGKAVQLMAPMAGGSSLLYRQELVDGRSPVIQVGDQAVTIVLYARERELARRAVVLESPGVNSVDF